MQTTMNLLEDALKVQSIGNWTRQLGLSKQALYTAKDRGHLSPAIAGALADELGDDPKKWIVIAALESERESACKARMVRKLAGAFASVVVAVGATVLVAPSPAIAQMTEPSLYIMLSVMAAAAWFQARSKLGL